MFMKANTEAVNDMLRAAIRAVRAGGKSLPQVLDQIPAAIYITDSEGVVTHYNRSCLTFAGRRPRIGQDRWCVTWKLYTEEGECLPHDQCPMAVAIRERRAIRGVRAVAERPDGTHVGFQPYPTPLLDEAGRLVAAVNLLARPPARPDLPGRGLRQGGACDRAAPALTGGGAGREGPSGDPL